MIEPGDTGVDSKTLARFLEGLPGLNELGVFPGRFTLELRASGIRNFLHVDPDRLIIRPVIPEDSRKTLVSLPRSLFVALVESGDPGRWKSALESGEIDVS